MSYHLHYYSQRCIGPQLTGEAPIILNLNRPVRVERVFMKITNTIVTFALITATSLAFANNKGPGDVGSVASQTIDASEISVAPSDIDQVVRLVDTKSNGSQKKVQVLVLDKGMSTDVSPRYEIYLGYSSLAEMGNRAANFKISDLVWSFKSASRISAGIYEIKTVEIDENADFGFKNVTYLIDATKMFSDDKAAVAKCGDDFCDQSLKTSILVKKTATKATQK